MSTIIVATDGSPAARAAVDRGISEALSSGSHLELLGAWSVPAGGELGYTSEDVLYADRDGIAQVLADAKAAAAGAGVDADTRLVCGDAAAEICREASERSADLIVMGTRGHKPLAAAFLGSCAARVVAHAPCPVMIVPPERTGPAAREDAR
jgi:nucleotide-binding universal stress UspA family protein